MDLQTFSVRKNYYITFRLRCQGFFEKKMPQICFFRKQGDQHGSVFQNRAENRARTVALRRTTVLFAVAGTGQIAACRGRCFLRFQLGDTCLLSALRRLGERRLDLLFRLSAPFQLPVGARDEQGGDDRGQKIGERHGVQHTVQPKEQGKQERQPHTKHDLAHHG